VRAVWESPGAGALAMLQKSIITNNSYYIPTAIYIFISQQIDGLAENFCLLKYAHAEVGYIKCFLSKVNITLHPR